LTSKLPLIKGIPPKSQASQEYVLPAELTMAEPGKVQAQHRFESARARAPTLARFLQRWLTVSTVVPASASMALETVKFPEALQPIQKVGPNRIKHNKSNRGASTKRRYKSWWESAGCESTTWIAPHPVTRSHCDQLTVRFSNLPTSKVRYLANWTDASIAHLQHGSSPSSVVLGVHSAGTYINVATARGPKKCWDCLSRSVQ
jgi:hypothetical protein